MVVFDFDGHSIFEYSRDIDRHNNIPNFIYNYGFLAKNEASIYYLAYTGFEIVEFNFKDFSSTILLKLPEEKDLNMPTFWNPQAFSKKGENWYFISPDRHTRCSRIFRMNPKKEIEQIGQCIYAHSIKGLKDGKFFVPFVGSGEEKKCLLIEV